MRMAANPEELAHRLTTIEGQIRALSDHLADGERSPGEVAHLVALIDGGWGRVRAAVLRGWVRECLQLADLDSDEDRLAGHLDAIERVGRHF